MTMTAVCVDGGGPVSPPCARWDRRGSVESGCPTEGSQEEAEGPARRLTPFERLTRDMAQDDKVVREITLGKRIGFYRIRGEIGSGNFSQVKLGVHSLTKGRTCPPPPRRPPGEQNSRRSWAGGPGPGSQGRVVT